MTCNITISGTGTPVDFSAIPIGDLFMYNNKIFKRLPGSREYYAGEKIYNAAEVSGNNYAWFTLTQEVEEVTCEVVIS